MLITLFKKFIQISVLLLAATICSANPPATGDAKNFSSTWTEAYFRGTPNSWGITAMKLVGNNTWETDQDFSGQANPRFKIDRHGDWSENYPSQDFMVQNKQYRIRFDDSSKKVTIEEISPIVSKIGTAHPASGAYSPVDAATWATANWPLGAHFVAEEGGDLTVAVYSQHATRMLLEIYTAATGAGATYDYWMAKGPDNIWRAKLHNVPGKTLYAFRAWGPNWSWNSNWNRGNSAAGFMMDVDADGNRFNPNKVLYDPYARELSHDKETPAMSAAGENGGMYGTGGTDVAAGQTYQGPITGGVAINRRNVDTGQWAPKSIALVDKTDSGTKPAIAQKDAITYEAHVRGLTAHPSVVQLSTILSGIPGFEAVGDIPDQYRGTYKGAGYMAKYLKALGFTTIELLPVQETANDNNPGDKPGGNFWGYMTYGFFAPDRHYSADKSPGGPTREFKEMVKAFHDAGLEVYLDVVYNHTGEGGNWDATKKVAEVVSFRGLDNADYYALVANDKGSFWETTGCGNNFDASKPVVKQLIKDSLVYWTTEMGVDGFRFDLAPVLGRDAAPNYNFNPQAALLKDIAAMTDTYKVEMIAEAWDIGTFQVGQFPAKWAEWNGNYRDGIRRFMKGDGNTDNFTRVVNGDFEDYNDQGGPQKSVNFIVAHDGFTLTDLVSYNGKNNQVSWPFGPSDGGNDSNDSWNSNGDQSLRRQRLKNFWTVQFFSRGVPMVVYGDEFGRTQNGNNNAYNVDGVGTWNNYTMINTDSPDRVATGVEGAAYHDNLGTDARADQRNTLFSFAHYLASVRQAQPGLRQDNYSIGYDFRKEDGSSWLNSGDRCVWIRIDGSAAGGSDFLVFVNSFTSKVDFKVPAPDTGKKWVRIIDTANWAEKDNDNYWLVTDPAAFTPASYPAAYGVQGWSVAVFQETK